MDFQAMADGLAAAVLAVDGIRSCPWLTDKIDPPPGGGFFVVGELEISYDETFHRGLDSVMVTCRLYTSRADERTGWATLRALQAGSGPRSLKAAIETDRTLGGACKTLIVRRVKGDGLYQAAGVDYFGARYDVQVWGAG